MLLQSVMLLLPLTPMRTEALVATCQRPSEADCSTRTANDKEITDRRHRLAATHLTETANTAPTATTAANTTTSTTMSINPATTDKSCTKQRPGGKLRNSKW
jgi:hypothetical protein